jgi:hypothetical protein
MQVVSEIDRRCGVSGRSRGGNRSREIAVLIFQAIIGRYNKTTEKVPLSAI